MEIGHPRRMECMKEGHTNLVDFVRLAGIKKIEG
jgi:hypothetical protein